jgi:cell division protein FtsN
VKAPAGGQGKTVPPVTEETGAGPDSSREAPAAPLPYTLQVGAFSTSENAQKQKLFFEDLGYTAEITNRVRGGRSLYLVWVGSYSSTDEARKTLREIQSKYNISPIVVER